MRKIGFVMPDEAVPPLLCAHLLPRVDEKLIDLLSSLDNAEWDLQTIAPLWKIRDVAAHLLDTALRKLSMLEMLPTWKRTPHSPRDVIALVNRLNQEGVTVYRRLSPRVMIDLMKEACEQSACFHESLDPFAPAAFNVSWAGEERSLNWFDPARELTERWRHQQQIRLAANRPGILTPELYHPVLDCFVRGLPYVYRNVAAPLGTLLLLKISGECGGKWFLLKGPEQWVLVTNSTAKCMSQVIISPELAWRVFTKGIDRASARPQIQIEGDRELGEKMLQLTAIVG